MTADHYATLGIAPTTEDVVIRAAYLALMRRYHPDTNASPAAAARARAITAAYEVLSDQDRRADYDRRRAALAGAGPLSLPLKDFPVGPIVFAVIVLLLVPLLAMAIRSPRSLPQPQPLGRPDQAQSHQIPASMQDPATRCASPATQDLIKRELFRQAAALRGSDPMAFEAIAAQSAVRIDSPVLTENRGELGTVSCRASIAIDLPAGVAVAGRRRSLMAEMGYAIEAESVGSSAAIILSNGILIARQLATLVQISPPADDLAVPTDVPDLIPAPIRPRLVDPPVVSKPPPPPLPRPQAGADPKPAKAIAQASRRLAKPGRGTAANSDSNLAALDRHVTLLYNQSWKYGDATKRTELLRTGDRFRVRRDECRSESCTRGVYLDRMREVADIMTGQPQPSR